ncbi:MAG: hypothetical protein AUH83_03010 [Deltaproteobacteria bacterium 13_1_40CM_4_68_19]|nr:MAG: hypothetical protein AUH83_03010 [Deltaproteobacteria bacterium 13_1_40CM_4_68_19]OLD09088.1 MAG: hypothetical protein AUI90_04985 [Deltaproteobacteria bacterium 13_1_40CM_3_69_14]
MADVQGTLFVARSTGPGTVREEKVPFEDLQALLDACSAAEGAALVRVQIAGTSAGQRRRLVLDFGYFGREGEE